LSGNVDPVRSRSPQGGRSRAFGRATSNGIDSCHMHLLSSSLIVSFNTKHKIYFMSDFIKQRSFELSYALFQLARVAKHKDLRARVEANAIYLLESAENSDSISTGKAIAVLRKLVILGEGIGEISYEHSRTINKQFFSLQSAIADYVASKHSEEKTELAVDINKIFEKGFGNELPSAAERPSKKIEARVNNVLANGSGNGNIKTENPSSEQGNNHSGGFAARQSAIFEKVGNLSMSGNVCRLKDLVASFSDVSERTLRYDLQKMCDQGLLERVGNGGPFSFYRHKDGARMLAASQLVNQPIG